jgi:hypothetical protein
MDTLECEGTLFGIFDQIDATEAALADGLNRFVVLHTTSECSLKYYNPTKTQRFNSLQTGSKNITIGLHFLWLI